MVRVSHGAVVQLQVGAVRTLEDAVAEAVNVLLLLLLRVGRQHLFGEADEAPLLGGGAWGGTDGRRGGVSGLTPHRGVLQRCGFCNKQRTKQV